MLPREDGAAAATRDETRPDHKQRQCACSVCAAYCIFTVGEKRAGNKNRAFLRQSDSYHVNNLQEDKGQNQQGFFLGVMRQRNKGCLRREADNKVGICFKAHQMDLSLPLASRS
ncbi:hypothetical protein SRHO_G00003730 [Serrasalmus rhombeus]